MGLANQRYYQRATMNIDPWTQ